MDEKAIQPILLTLLRAALNGEPLAPATAQGLNKEVLGPLYRLAKKHDLSHVISEILYQNRIKVEEGLRLRLQQQHYASVCRCEQMKYAQTQIYAAFAEAQIHYVPLKGAILRKFYPVDSMRTSCDIDILIHEKDLDRAVEELKKNGFRCGERHYHDVSLFAPNGIHLELHFTIQENRKNLDAILKKVWQYVTPTEETYQYAFTDEFFVFHMFAHMAYHFTRGGCGIRSLMDLWVMNHNMRLSYTKAETMLKKAGIYRFAQEMSRITEQAFTDGKTDEFSDTVLRYILSGGVYGSVKNHMAVKKTQANNTFGYALRRLFLPLDGMKSLYPVLKKAPILLPFCWIGRWFGMLFGGKLGNAVTELSRSHAIPESQMREIKVIFSRLDL